MSLTLERTIELSNPIGKVVIAGAAAVALTVAMFSSAFAVSPGDLKCFSGVDDGVNGTCVLAGNVATIDTTDGDSDPNNNYAGVYYEETSLSGALIGDVDALSFEYSGSGAVGGSPRMTVPIDKDDDGVTDTYVSMDTTGCSDGTPNAGMVDVVQDASCIVAENVGGASYANWAAYVATNPTYRVTVDGTPFVIVDQPGDFVLQNVVIGSQPVELTKESCKYNGWKTAMTADGKSFKSQGQCTAYVVSNQNSAHHKE